MKKLLNLLSIIIFSCLLIPNIITASNYKKQKIKLANNKINYQQINNFKKLIRNKRNEIYNKKIISTNDFLEFNNKYISKVFGINYKINKILVDNINNVYFFGNKEISILNYNEDTSKKIKEMNDDIIINDISIFDNENNVYFGTNKGAYKIFVNSNNITKINGFDDYVGSIAIDNLNNIYFGTYSGGYILKQGSIIATKIVGINEYIRSFIVDSKNNVYFKKNKPQKINDSLYVIKQGSTTATKIIGVSDYIDLIIIDNIDNVYFGTNYGAYILKQGSIIVTKINGINENIESSAFDSKNNVYFGTYSGGYILKQGSIIATKIKEINNFINLIIVNNKDNVYFGTSNGAYILKKETTKIIKINNINDTIIDMVADNEGCIYFLKIDDLYILENNELTAKKIINFNEHKDKQIELALYYFITIDKKNNIYFGINKDIYLLKKYDKKISKINEINNYNILSITNDNNDNIYFCTKNDFFVLKKDEEKPIKIKEINTFDPFLIIDKKDNIYFKNKIGIYKLINNSINSLKLENIPNNNKDESLLLNYHKPDFQNNIYFDKKNNIYFGTKNGLYILKQEEIKPIKIEGFNNYIYSFAVDKSNNIYIGTYNNGVYFLKHGEKTFVKLENIPNISILSIIIDNNNDIYFCTKNDFFVLKKDEEKPIKIKNINISNPFLIIDKKDNIYLLNRISNYYSKFNDFVFDKDDNLYLGAISEEIYILKKNNLSFKEIKNYYPDHQFCPSALCDNEHRTYWRTKGAFILKSGEETLTKLNEIDSIVNTISIDKNNNIFFGTENGLYLLQNKSDLNLIIKNNFNLNKILNNKDETILNNLNYLNREKNYFLNLNKIKLIDKTDTSAIIKIIKGKYYGQIIVNYKIKNKNEINNINLNNLLQKAAYFNFIDKNFFSIDKIKEIKEINNNNLNFLNIKVMRDSKLLHNINYRDVCFKSKKYNNNSSLSKIIIVPTCEYYPKSKLSFQIITGLNKIKHNTKSVDWNINIDDELKLSDFVNINNNNYEIINDLSNNFDLSNIDKQENEVVLQKFIKEIEDEKEIKPYKSLIIKYSVREINIETTLNLKQKISGTFSAKIINENNEEQITTLSIKEAMKILQKYSLLPDEININKDNSITFNGKAKISLIQESEPKLILKSSNI